MSGRFPVVVFSASQCFYKRSTLPSFFLFCCFQFQWVSQGAAMLVHFVQTDKESKQKTRHWHRLSSSPLGTKWQHTCGFFASRARIQVKTNCCLFMLDSIPIDRAQGASTVRLILHQPLPPLPPPTPPREGGAGERVVGVRGGGEHVSEQNANRRDTQYKTQVFSTPQQH